MPRKEYYEKNKEKCKLQKKLYYENNKEKCIETNKLWNENNKDKIDAYKQSDKYKKSVKISMWKFIGIKSDNFDELYEKYINCNVCEECGKEDIKGHNKMLDHDHNTGLFRNIICNSCNQKRAINDKK